MQKRRTLSRPPRFPYLESDYCAVAAAGGFSAA